MAQVFVLGAGTPTPTPHRWGSAFAIEVGGELLEFQLGGREYLGRIAATGGYSTTRSNSVQLDEARFMVTNVLISGVRARRPDGWFAQVQVTNGMVALDGSKRVSGEVSLQMLEERIALLRDLCTILDGLYGAFLKTRASSAWESQTGAIRKWINKPEKASAAA